MDALGNLSKREAFQSGFWDGLEGKEGTTTEWGFLETTMGSVRPTFIEHYKRGAEFGKRVADLPLQTGPDPYDVLDADELA